MNYMMDNFKERYELLERLLDDEKLYLDRELTFSRICEWLNVPVVIMDCILMHELGVDGEGLLEAFRAGEAARLRELYGIDVFF